MSHETPLPNNSPTVRSAHHVIGKTDVVRKNFHCQVKGFDLQAKTVTVIVTTGSLDRDNEIILPSSLDELLYIFEENPLLLWGHKQRGEPEDALGHAIKFTRLADAWEVTFRYAVDVNEKAAKVFDLVVDGTLRAYSIGFIPHAWVTTRSPSEALAGLPSYARELLQMGVCKTVYTLIEVVEISNVLIGSNRDAIRRAAAKGLVGAENFEEETMQDRSQAPLAATIKAVESPAPEPAAPAALPAAAAAPVAKAPDAPPVENSPEPEVKKKMHPMTADICTRLRTVADNLEGYLDPDYWWRTADECNEPPRASIVAGAKAVIQSVADQLSALEQEATQTAVAAASATPSVLMTSAPVSPTKAAELKLEDAPVPAAPAPELSEADVLDEAATIALRAVEDALRVKGVDPATLLEDQLADLVASMLAE